MRHGSIKAKILIALLVVSLLPLLLFVVISRTGMVDVRDRVKTAFIADAKEGLLQLAEDQAVIADAMLDQVDAETRLVAHITDDAAERAFARARRSHWRCGG